MMAGRPRAPTFIVPPNDVLTPAEVAADRWRLGPLYQQLGTTNQCLQWVAKRRLFHNVVMCSNCNVPASLVKREEHIDGCRWQCRHCGFTKAIRADSFFERSHLPIANIVIAMYCWSCDMPQQIICHEADIALRCTNWCSFFSR